MTDQPTTKTPAKARRPIDATNAVESTKTTFQTALNCAISFGEGSAKLDQLMHAWVSKKFGAATANLLRDDGQVDREDVQLSIQADARHWHFRCEHPDHTRAIRDWLTDVKISAQGDIALLAVRNACRFWADAGPATNTVPRFVGAWVQDVRCQDGGESLEIGPRWVDDDSSLDRCLDHLESATRRLPVVLVAPHGRTTNYSLDMAELASRLAGAAHVVGVTDEMSYGLTDEYGKYASVFNGAVHCYWPEFSVNVDTSHQLYRPPQLPENKPAVHHPGFLRFITEQVLSRTTRWKPLTQCVTQELPPLMR